MMLGTIASSDEIAVTLWRDHRMSTTPQHRVLRILPNLPKQFRLDAVIHRHELFSEFQKPHHT